MLEKKLSEIVDFINEIEANFPVNKWIIDGIHIWPIIRIRLMFDLTYKIVLHYEEKTLISNIASKISLGYRLLQKLVELTKFCYSYFKDYLHNDIVAKKVDALFLSDGVSFALFNGLWYEKFCDPLIQVISEQNFSSLLMTPLAKYYIPRHTPSIFIQPILEIIKITKIIQGIFLKERRNFEEMAEFAEFTIFVYSKYPNIVLPSFSQLKKQISLIRALTDFYKVILNKVKPSIGFLVSYYSNEGMAFNLACHELGIPSVDIQHGAQGELHAAYGRWNKVPEKGYELLPAYFWVWSDFEAEAINNWSNKISEVHKPIVGGNLLLQIWQSGKNNLVKIYDNQIAEIKGNDKENIHILYTLNGLEDFDKLKFIAHIMNNSPSNWCWWIRLHPCWLKNKKKIKNLLQKHSNSNFLLDSATELPLYSLLRNMDIHVTEFSSTVIESELFGVPSVVIHEMGKQLYSEQIASGIALPAYTADEIIKAIQMQLNRKKSVNKTQDNYIDFENKEGMKILLKILNK